MRSEVETRLDGAVTSISIQPTEDGVARYLRDKLKNDAAPEIMSNTLEVEILKVIPEINSETYVKTSARQLLP